MQIERLANIGLLAPSTVNRDARTVTCVVLSGQPIKRYDVFTGEEFDLLFDARGGDFSRVTAGSCPVLDSHATVPVSAQIGRVLRAWAQDGRVYAELQFSETAERIWRDIADGITRGVSAGVEVAAIEDERDQRGWLTRRVRRWALLEVSIVTVPADGGAVTLSHGGFSQMTTPVPNPESRIPPGCGRDRGCGRGGNPLACGQGRAAG